MKSRRDLLKGLALTPMAAVFADPRLARAAASTTTDVTITTAGGDTVSGALAEPEGAAKAGVVLIHEWWGLNDQIKAAAVEFAKNGYATLAVDLFRGKVAETANGARTLTRKLKADRATETMTAWVEWMRGHAKSQGKVATCGWCFGGGWSLNASIASPVDATVIYYGRVNKAASELASLRGPVLGHFATQDQNIDREMVGGFEAAMREAGKTFTNHWYDAQHGFANPTTARYDEEDARLAWQRTMEFLDRQVG